ncbi:MAG: DUF4097 domain-containing protein [Gammaproteobacteria bacterium]|nr:DUF4097 domain-containing protein [Gammaproteobacteria bacterium]
MNTRITTLAAAGLLCLAAPAEAEQNLQRKAAVSADAAIEISNVSGRVEVTAWDRNEVDLDATLTGDEDQLEFEAGDRRVRIKVTRPDKKLRGPKEATLILRVPQGASLRTEVVSADLEIRGVRGEQRLNSVSGDVHTEAFTAPVALRTISGDGTIAGTGGKAEVSVASVSGTLEVTNVQGSAEAETVSGEVTMRLGAVDRLKVGTVSGEFDGSLELLPGARVELESISGEMDLRLKPPVNADFEFESFSGDIEACFGPKAQAKSKYGPGRELSFTQGSGGALVQIETMSGEVRVCDH